MRNNVRFHIHQMSIGVIGMKMGIILEIELNI